MLRQVIKSLPITVSSLTLIRSSLTFAASLVQTHLVSGISLVLLEGTSHDPIQTLFLVFEGYQMIQEHSMYVV